VDRVNKDYKYQLFYTDYAEGSCTDSSQKKQINHL